jgi:AraC-like DNA-binding protein
MKPIPLIRASSALAFVELLADGGAPTDRLWARAGLPPSALLDPDRPIPLHQANLFIEGSAADQGVTDLGLRVARRAGFGSGGQFGAAIARQPTLQKAIETACLMVPSHNSGARYWLAHEGASVRLCRRFRVQDARFRQADLLVVALMIDLVRSVAGPQWRPARIELQSSAEYELRACEALGDAEIVVGRPATSITFPRAFLCRALPRPAVHVEARPASDATSPPPPTDFIASLEVVVRSLLEVGRADVGTAAQIAGTSLRSFQRRLTALHESYSDVVDRVRHRTAARLLEENDVKVTEIALALGYSDPAHFTRAFRRWTSLTPVAYRHLHLAGDEGVRRSA